MIPAGGVNRAAQDAMAERMRERRQEGLYASTSRERDRGRDSERIQDAQEFGKGSHRKDRDGRNGRHKDGEQQGRHQTSNAGSKERHKNRDRDSREWCAASHPGQVRLANLPPAAYVQC